MPRGGLLVSTRTVTAQTELELSHGQENRLVMEPHMLSGTHTPRLRGRDLRRIARQAWAVPNPSLRRERVIR